MLFDAKQNIRIIRDAFCRASTHSYFYYWFIYWLFSQFMDCLIEKNAEMSHIFYLLVQNSNIQFTIYATSNSWHLCLKKWSIINWLLSKWLQMNLTQWRWGCQRLTFIHFSQSKYIRQYMQYFKQYIQYIKEYIQYSMYSFRTAELLRRQKEQQTSVLMLVTVLMS